MSPGLHEAPLLCLHGLAGGPEDFGELLREFGRREGGDVRVPEMPWSGRNGFEWVMESTSESLLAPILAGLAPGTIVVAHSFGANVFLEALRQDLARPDLAGTVLAAPYFRGEASSFTWSWMVHYQEAFDALLREAIASQSPRCSSDEAMLSSMTNVLKERVGALGWWEFQRLFQRTTLLTTLPQRILVLSGERDQGATPGHAAELALRIGAEGRIVEGAGHFLLRERSRRCRSLVEAWRDGVPV